MDTVILSEDEKQIFHDLLEKHNKDIGTRFDLLYRGSTDNPKFCAENCLKQSLGKSGTVTLIETESNNVFGVYTEYKWQNLDRNGEWHHDKNAFCFLLRSSAQHPPNIFEQNYDHNGKNEFTLQTYKRYLCIFGMHGTIMIWEESNPRGKGTVANGSSFSIPDNFHLNGGKRRFQTKEYEVWYCIRDQNESI